MENICEGCRAWREKYHYAMGVRCGENIARTAKRAEKALCSYCWEARAEHHTPRSEQPSAHSGRSTPVQNALLQSPPPPPQLHDICARMEVMLGRMEGVLGLLVSQSQAANAPPPPPGIAAHAAPNSSSTATATAWMSSRGGPGPLAAPRGSELAEPLREPGWSADDVGAPATTAPVATATAPAGAPAVVVAQPTATAVVVAEVVGVRRAV